MRAWVVALLIIVILMGAAIAVSLALFWMLETPVDVSRNSVLEVGLEGSIFETPSQNPLLQLLSPDRLSLIDYWQLFKGAAKDDRIRGVLLEIQPLAMSWAQIEELRSAIIQFRQSGKPVHAIMPLELISEPELYLASAADSITANPDSTLLINGLMAEVTFYQKTLSKLGVKAQFIQLKEFKSPEVYMRNTLSGPIRQMLESILTDLQQRFVGQVARDRGIDPSVIEEVLAEGILSPQKAVEWELIDEVGYLGEVRERFQLGEDYQSIGQADYLETVGKRYGAKSSHRIALVTASGVITSGKSDPFSETLGGSSLSGHLRSLRKREDFDAVLMRVNSPGGSAVGSDMVWKEVELLQEEGIPVVVSMSGVAGSGGYYIAMGADRIICQPSTITGSIGVIFGKFDIEGLYNWLGMEVERVKLSPNADLFSPFTSLDESQYRKVEAWMAEVYEGFVRKAAEGRGTSFEELEGLARGRIYTGSQAVALGLADAVGGFDTALEELREVLDLEEDADLELVLYPRPKTFWEALSGSGLVEAELRQFQLKTWLDRELRALSTAAPRLLMPEVEIR